MTSTSKSPPKIAHYQLVSRLGKGAMGSVYRARDTRLERDVAIKLVDVSLEDADKHDYAARLMQEARSAAKLNHPGIITVFDAGRWHGKPYLVMELVRGETLKSVLDKAGSLPIPKVIQLAEQIFDALAHAHTHGVVHRDIKPANLMLTPEGRLKIMDFGIAQLPASDLTRTGAVLGSPRHMAPEQLAGGKLDGRADLFAAGVVLYQSLTGALPFDADHPVSIAYQILHATPADPATLRRDAPAWLAQVILTCLAKKADDRFANAEEAVTAVRSGEMPPARAARLSEHAEKIEQHARLAAQQTVVMAQASARTGKAIWHASAPWRERAWYGTKAIAAHTVSEVGHCWQTARPHLARGSTRLQQGAQHVWQHWMRLPSRTRLVLVAAAILPLALLALWPDSNSDSPTGSPLDDTASAPIARDALPVIKLRPPGHDNQPAVVEPATTEAKAAPVAEPARMNDNNDIPVAMPEEDRQETAEVVSNDAGSSSSSGLPSGQQIKQDLGEAGTELKRSLGTAWRCLNGSGDCPKGEPPPDRDAQRRP
ncbi:serine/threonine-protein kinase [Chitinibacteraceae bacterium HSL-7]